jgi:two-component sensor histidine kinase
MFKEQNDKLATDVSEADHRIANHLTLLMAMAQREMARLPAAGTVEATEVRALLRDLSLRIEAIANLHRLISAKAGERVAVVRLVGEVCAHLRAVAPPGQVLLSMDCATDAEISGEQASWVARIVSEILTNALKYAHPTGIALQLDVTCQRMNDAIKIEISDDGVGLPEHFDSASGGGVGFKMMRSAIQRLGGRLEFDSGPTGLTSRLVVPLDSADRRNVIDFATHAM